MRFGGDSFGGLTVLPGHYMDHYWGDGCLMALNGRKRGIKGKGARQGGDLHREKDVNVV